MVKIPKFLLSRLAQMLPVLFLASVIVFAITNLLPGDPTYALLGETASVMDMRQSWRVTGMRPISMSSTYWLR